MAEQTSQEPTMEEILASIRRIISEDESPEADSEATSPQGDAPAAELEVAPASAGSAPEPAPEGPVAGPVAEPQPVAAEAPPEPAPAAQEEEEDEPLELTEKVETHGDLDVYTPPAAPRPPPPAAAGPAPTPAVESLVSARAAEAAASAFGKLSQVVTMPAEGRTLEDVVRELLKPLLQQWLDEHLATIVQEAVQAEVERIARGRVR